VCFEALEQTLRLRLVSGPVDKKFFFISRNSLSHTVAVDLFKIFSNSENGFIVFTRVRRIRTLLRRARVELFIQLMAAFGPNFPSFRGI
jgi:hypothetical protein